MEKAREGQEHELAGEEDKDAPSVLFISHYTRGDWCVRPLGSYQYLFEIFYIRIAGQSFVGVQQSRTFPRTAVSRYDMDLSKDLRPRLNLSV